jgi:molybdate transport system regulatory protein
MRTSARNQFVGRVISLREGAVSLEVGLRLDPAQLMWSVITRASAELLSLEIGSEVHALVKASSVLLLTDPGLRISARNQLWGEVTVVHEGAVNSEVTLALPGGRNVTSTLTCDSVTRLGLEPGSAACAVFEASQVILATFD